RKVVVLTIRKSRIACARASSQSATLSIRRRLIATSAAATRKWKHSRRSADLFSEQWAVSGKSVSRLTPSASCYLPSAFFVLLPRSQTTILLGMVPPTFQDILAARDFISSYLPKTPLIRVAGI